MTYIVVIAVAIALAIGLICYCYCYGSALGIDANVSSKFTLANNSSVHNNMTVADNSPRSILTLAK